MQPRKNPVTTQYEVEKIVGKRTSAAGKVEFRVKWKGYKTTTWEPEESCLCDDAIDIFEKSQNNSDGTTPSSSSRQSVSKSGTASAVARSGSAGSNVTSNQTLTTSTARRSTRGGAATGTSNNSHTSSGQSSPLARRSTRISGGGGSSNGPLVNELTALITAHSSLSGNRKRPSTSAVSSLQAKILKPDELKGIQIWSFTPYKEWAESEGLDLTRSVNEKEAEKFLGEKIEGIVGHFPHGQSPYFLIKTEVPVGTQMVINDVVHGVECVLATLIFPKIVAKYTTELAYSTYLGDQRRGQDAGMPSTSRQ